MRRAHKAALTIDAHLDVRDDVETPASHSAARARVDVPRNLTNAELRAIAAKGGVVHIVAFAPYVSASPETAANAARRLRSLRETDNLTATTRELLKRGYSGADVRQLWGGNFLRVLAAVEATAQQLRKESTNSAP